MAIELPALPYDRTALEPHISKETLDYHYGKHHQGYVDKLNAAIENTDMADMDLESIIKKASGGLFNNAAQTWNHTFYWNSMSPNGGGDPDGKLADALNKAFDSTDGFREEFAKQAGGNFGSGWTWLVQRPDGSLAIVNTSNAGTLTTSTIAMPVRNTWMHSGTWSTGNLPPATWRNFSWLHPTQWVGCSHPPWRRSNRQQSLKGFHPSGREFISLFSQRKRTTNASGTYLNGEAGPQGGGQDARSKEECARKRAHNCG